MTLIDTTIPGWFHQPEADAIIKAAESIGPAGWLVESGTWCGRSADVFARALPEWVIATVDAYPGYAPGFLYDSDPAAMKAEAAEAIAQRTLAKHLRVNMFKMTPVDYAKMLRQEAPSTFFDVAFIDGWHEPEAVEEDARALLPRMKDRAFMFFHDAEHWRFGADVQKGIARIAWPFGERWRRDHTYEAGSLHCWRRG